MKSSTIYSRPSKIIVAALIILIKIYQKISSFTNGAFGYFIYSLFPFGYFRNKKCKFYPSCSVYVIDALSFFGLRKGLVLGIWRIVRCHPFSKGGFDPVLKENKKVFSNSR